MPTSTRPTRRQHFLAARENPLCMWRLKQVRYRFGDHDWAWHLARLHDLNFRAAIVGKRGSGKTTLLNELKGRFSAVGIKNHHVFLPQTAVNHKSLIDQAIRASRTGQVVLVDGIERLRFTQRQKLFRKTSRGAGLVICVHTHCRLPTWIRTRTHPALMSNILCDLKLDFPDIQTAGQTAFENSNGNIRDALADLYDQFASGRFNAFLSS